MDRVLYSGCYNTDNADQCDQCVSSQSVFEEEKLKKDKELNLVILVLFIPHQGC